MQKNYISYINSDLVVCADRQVIYCAEFWYYYTSRVVPKILESNQILLGSDHKNQSLFCENSGNLLSCDKRTGIKSTLPPTVS